jgi:hypothetical protein
MADGSDGFESRNQGDNTPVIAVGIRSRRGPACGRWRRFAEPVALIGVCFLLLPALAIPDRASALQLSEEDQIRLAAFEHLATVLFPADTSAERTNCISLRAEADIDGAPEGPGRDPGPALLGRIRRFVPRASPVSECGEPGGTERAGDDVSPVLYFVGALTQAGSTMRVPVGYLVSGNHGGGWVCTCRLDGDEWRVVDCLPTWISAPLSVSSPKSAGIRAP